MEQIFLIAPPKGETSHTVLNVLHTLPVRPVGFRLLPYTVAGQCRGEMLHFFAPEADPLYNDIPCTLRLSADRTLSLEEVWAEVAAPTLRHCLPRRAPILLDHLVPGALHCPAFMEAFDACIQGQSPLVTVVPQEMEERVQTLYPPEKHLWLRDDDLTGEALAQEILLRL